MSLPYHPWVRPSIGGWVVVATTTAGLELVWGPYPVRADAAHVCQSLTVRLIDARAAAMRRAAPGPPGTDAGGPARAVRDAGGATVSRAALRGALRPGRAGR